MNANPHLKKFLDDTPDIPDQDDDHELPRLGSDAYRPYARPANKPVYAFHVIRADGSADSFLYYQLDSGARYEPGKIKLRFLGFKAWEVTIEGRKL